MIFGHCQNTVKFSVQDSQLMMQKYQKEKFLKKMNKRKGESILFVLVFSFNFIAYDT